jgi:SAM-dependent methyltransferase
MSAATSIGVDDWATDILDLARSTNFGTFRRDWLRLGLSQGIPLREAGPFNDELAFNHLLLLDCRLLEFDYVNTARRFLNNFSAYGLVLPPSLTVRLCIGGAFNARVRKTTVFLSLDQIQFDDLELVLVHELAHVCTPTWSGGCLPLQLDRRLWLEAVAIKVTKDIFPSRLIHELLFIPQLTARLWLSKVDELLEKFRCFRLSYELAKAASTDPFTADCLEADSRFGYMLALLLLSEASPEEIRELLADSRSVRKRVTFFLEVDDHSEANLLGAGPLEFVGSYEALAGARRLSWNGGFDWLARFYEASRRHSFSVKSLLDVGCGSGFNAKQLASVFETVHGVEKSSAMLAQSEEGAANMILLNEDFFDWKPPRKYSVVISCFDVINSMLSQQDVLTVLKKLADCLDGGGHLVFDFITNEIGKINQNISFRQSGAASPCEVAEVPLWDSRSGQLEARSYVRFAGSTTIHVDTDMLTSALIEDVVGTLEGHGVKCVQTYDFSTMQAFNRSSPYSPRRILYVGRSN